MDNFHQELESHLQSAKLDDRAWIRWQVGSLLANLAEAQRQSDKYEGLYKASEQVREQKVQKENWELLDCLAQADRMRSNAIKWGTQYKEENVRLRGALLFLFERSNLSNLDANEICSIQLLLNRDKPCT